MHRRANQDLRVVGVSDAMRGFGLSVEGQSFPLHNPMGFGTQTICDLYGRPFVVIVKESDGTEYEPVDMEKVVISAGLLLDVNITPDEMTAVATLLGGGDAIVVRNLVTWYRIVQFVTNKAIHLALANGDVLITVQAKLHVHLSRNFTTAAVTVELQQNQVYKSASSATDTPSDVIPCVAGLMAMPVADFLAVFHVPGVQHKKDGTSIRRTGKNTQAGLLLDRPRRVLSISLVAKCGACHTHLTHTGAHTDAAASVHVALCGACTSSGATIGGARFALAGGPKRRLVRQGRQGREGSVAEKSAPLTESGSAVGIAVLLAIERNSSIEKGGTAMRPIVNPLARCIAELAQFGAIVGPKLVFSSSAWWKLRVKINLRRIVQKCHTRLVGERAVLEAECDKLKRGEVKKKSGPNNHLLAHLFFCLLFLQISAVDLHSSLHAMLAATPKKRRFSELDSADSADSVDSVAPPPPVI